MALLLHDIEKVPLNEEASDTILWMTQNTGHFSVNSCCKALNSEGDSSTVWLWKAIIGVETALKSLENV